MFRYLFFVISLFVCGCVSQYDRPHAEWVTSGYEFRETTFKSARDKLDAQLRERLALLESLLGKASSLHNSEIASILSKTIEVEKKMHADLLKDLDNLERELQRGWILYEYEYYRGADRDNGWVLADKMGGIKKKFELFSYMPKK